MRTSEVTVVLAHGAWADGSSWSKVIRALRFDGIDAVTVPLPLTSLADDVAGGTGRNPTPDFAGVHHCVRRTSSLDGHSNLVPVGRAGSYDCSADPAIHGRAYEGADQRAPGRPHPERDRSGGRRGINH